MFYLEEIKSKINEILKIWLVRLFFGKLVCERGFMYVREFIILIF